MNESDLSGTSSLATDLQVLHHERLKHDNHPIIGYLNINMLAKYVSRSKSYPKAHIITLLCLK